MNLPKKKKEKEAVVTFYILHSGWGTWTGNLLEVAQCNYDKHESELSGQVKTSPSEDASNKGSSTWFISDEEHQSVAPSSKLFLHPVDRQLHVWQLRCLALLMSGGLVASQTGRWKPVDCFSTLFPPTTDQPVLIHRCNTTFRSLLLFNSMLMSWARMWGNHLNIACDNKTLIFHAVFLVAIKSSMQEVF